MQSPFLKRRSGISIRSVIIPILLIMVLFFVAGFYIISTTRDFFYREKNDELALLARGYTESLGTVIAAEYQMDQQMYNTLSAAGTTIRNFKQPFTNEILFEMANDMNVDVMYLYNQDLVLINSSDDSHIGWKPEAGHPVQTFYESGLQSYVEEIRQNMVSGILYKYGYYRLPDERIIQIGLFTEPLSDLYAQFESQHLIDKLMAYSTHTRLAFLDTQGRVIASSDPTHIESLVSTTMTESPLHLDEYRRFSWEGQPYLVLHTSIQDNGTSGGSLLLFYEMTTVEEFLKRLFWVIVITMGMFFILFSYSIIHIHRKNQQIVTIAYHDELTGLPNHRYFQALVAGLSPIPLACLILNPRNFKLLNIMYGYSYGNEVLVHIADALVTLQEHLKTLQAFRLSDDRFIILMHSMESEEQLDSLCTSLQLLGTKYHEEDPLEFSIGIAFTETAGHDPSRLIKQASIALNATTSENPIQRYDSSMEELLLHNDTIEQELKRAIRGEEGILSLVFQPIVHAQDGSIHGFEALARMESPKLGLIPPLEFITLAEQRHLIIGLGEKILDLATDFLQAMQTRFDETIYVAINISALQIMEESFTHKLQDLAQYKQIDLRRVELELTESIFSGDIHHIASQLQNLHQLGVKISIDDFGTGFSSLSRLASLEIDILKLDKMFVSPLSKMKDQELVSDLISMAHHLGKHVIAEGVETENQRTYLQKVQCDLLQGFFFSRPVSFLDALSLLEHGKGQDV
ncbi:MAG: putative bifunctional diguanylate cyclase/phosphodiesterase [Sphaerochaetaceae bacterium]